MNDFATELQALADRLRESPAHTIIDFELGAPVSDEEIERVHRRLGFSLDERFLSYFRSANGVKLCWLAKEGDATREELLEEYQELYWDGLEEDYEPGTESVGSFFLPCLDAIFHDPAATEVQWGAAYAEGQVPLLGGFDNRELRESLRWIDRNPPLPDALTAVNPDPEDSDQIVAMVGLLAHPRFPDPLCIFAEDNGASISGCHPMRARSYFDLMAATAGGAAAKQTFRFSRGCEGDYPIIELPRDHFAGAGYLENEEAHAARLRELAARLEQ